MQRSDFVHLIEQPIRWGDMDALGHVNNVEFFRYFESGRIAYVDDLLPDAKLSNNTILADIQCAFRRQLHYPQVVEVGTRVARIGNSSLQLTCAVFVKGDPEPAATGRAVIVWFDFTTQRPARLPDHLRSRIAALEVIPPEQQDPTP